LTFSCLNKTRLLRRFISFVFSRKLNISPHLHWNLFRFSSALAVYLQQQKEIKKEKLFGFGSAIEYEYYYC